ncbi:type II toxin-antitoxin system VapC family toxin [Candidatus Woesearchaeota archaeon]|nr:type II toxin-antitoxin system VapC family toxin [Candidatus Woesearchaeota archaeon]
MLLDTSAWVELLKGSEKSKAVTEAIVTEECFTSIITLSEITNWCLKNNLSDKINKYIRVIGNQTTILGINADIAVISGKLNYERKKRSISWGIADSVIAATSIVYGLRILTKDYSFGDLPNSKML